MWRFIQIWLPAILLGVMLPGDALSQRTGHTPAELQDIGVDERLGQHIPLDLVFQDESGREVTLGDYFDGTRPVVLTLTYHDCPMLCNLILDGFAQTLDGFAWLPGDEFEVVSVSFGESETPEMAANQKERYMRMLERPGMEDGWHFLVGESEAIDALTDAVGFNYKWDERQQEYAHPAVLIFLGPDGLVSRYIYGIQFPQRQFRNALVEASEGKIGTTLDQVLLFCFQFDPNANSYVLHAANFMKLGGALTVLILGAFLIILWRRDRRTIDAGAEAPALT